MLFRSDPKGRITGTTPYMPYGVDPAVFNDPALTNPILQWNEGQKKRHPKEYAAAQEAQQAAMQAQQMDMAFKQAQTQEMSAKAAKEQAEAQKTMIEAQLIPEKHRVDIIQAAATNLDNGNDFEKRLKLADVMLKEKQVNLKAADIASNERIATLQMMNRSKKA